MEKTGNTCNHVRRRVPGGAAAAVGAALAAVSVLGVALILAVPEPADPLPAILRDPAGPVIADLWGQAAYSPVLVLVGADAPRDPPAPREPAPWEGGVPMVIITSLLILAAPLSMSLSVRREEKGRRVFIFVLSTWATVFAQKPGEVWRMLGLPDDDDPPPAGQGAG